MAEIVMSDEEKQIPFTEWDDASLGRAVKATALLLEAYPPDETRPDVEANSAEALKAMGAIAWLVDLVRRRSYGNTYQIDGLSYADHGVVGDWCCNVYRKMTVNSRVTVWGTTAGPPLHDDETEKVGLLLSAKRHDLVVETYRFNEACIRVKLTSPIFGQAKAPTRYERYKFAEPWIDELPEELQQQIVNVYLAVPGECGYPGQEEWEHGQRREGGLEVHGLKAIIAEMHPTRIKFWPEDPDDPQVPPDHGDKLWFDAGTFKVEHRPLNTIPGLRKGCDTSEEPACETTSES